MKKTTISVAFDEEKLSAAKLYMEQKGLSFETEMERAADALYGKYVPANVREFIEMSAGTKAVPKPKKPKPSPSSAVGAPAAKEGVSD
ncbi:MAG: DUF6103 family protein [Merdibacter sp.]